MLASGIDRKQERVSWLGLMREIARVSGAVETELTDQTPKEALTRRLLFFLFELDEVVRTFPSASFGADRIIEVFRTGLRFTVFDPKSHADIEQVSRCHSVGFALKKRMIHPSLAAMVLILIAERLRAGTEQPDTVPLLSLTHGSPLGSVQFQYEDRIDYCLTDLGLRFVDKAEWQRWCKDEKGLPTLGVTGALSNYFYSWLSALEMLPNGEGRIERSKCILWGELIRLNPQSTSLWYNLAQSQFSSGQSLEARQSLLRFISFHGTSRVSQTLMDALEINSQQDRREESQTEPAFL